MSKSLATCVSKQICICTSTICLALFCTASLICEKSTTHPCCIDTISDSVQIEKIQLGCNKICQYIWCDNIYLKY